MPDHVSKQRQAGGAVIRGRPRREEAPREWRGCVGGGFRGRIPIEIDADEDHGFALVCHETLQLIERFLVDRVFSGGGKAFPEAGCEQIEQIEHTQFTAIETVFVAAIECHHSGGAVG